MTPSSWGRDFALRWTAFALCLTGNALLGCGTGTDADVATPETQCSEASARTGSLACLHRLTSEADWQSLSVESDAVDQVRSAKYMLPARKGARLAPLFVDSRVYDLHYVFMAKAFPELFPGLTPQKYLELLFDPAQRELYVGELTEYRLTAGEHRFGFTLAEDPGSPGTSSCTEVRAVHAELARRLYAPTLAVVPESEAQGDWLPSCGLEVIDPRTVKYEAYHRAAGFGTVRRYKTSDLPAAIERADLGFQDILVLDQAPSDIATIVSGSITGTRQGPLSHLAVRSASRGTPNCYLDGAYDFLKDWEGKLVRVECGAIALAIREAALDEATAFWAGLKPEPVSLAQPDGDFSELLELEALDLSTVAARELAERRVGSKGKNLAWLRQNLDLQLTPKGMLVPVSYYLSFLNKNSWQVDLGTGTALHTFAETLDAWLDDPAFIADTRQRNAQLLALAAAFKTGTCDSALMAELAQRIPKVFGAATETVRFRSSSNAEDGAYFNGAGLYDSFSGCLADDLDADEAGPSQCDSKQKVERGVCDALKQVWASLWNPRAYIERAYFGIDQQQVVMGVLLNERSQAELSNLVAFNGNPVSAGDARYVINAQKGELPVVSPVSGVWPEEDLLTLQDGAVTLVERHTASSEVKTGEVVVSDDNLRLLGATLAKLSTIYPFDLTAPEGRELLLDSEWKVMPDGSLRVKQIRPFLK